jgi:methyl-accepting chemotaxis protein
MVTRVSLRTKLLGAFLIVGLLPFACIALLSLYQAQQAIGNQAFAQMESVRDGKKGEVERYLQTISNQIETFSQDHMVVSAMAEFTGAFPLFAAENGIDAGELDRQRGELAQYYRNDFSRAYQEQNDGKKPDTDRILGNLSPDTVSLQYLYIKANQNPLGSKDALDHPGDPSHYSRLHAHYHPVIRNYLNKFGYYDIFLVEPEGGRIVYSVFKELDYATSLLDGPYAATNFAEVFREANKATTAEAVFFTDFRQYFPSYEAPAGFVASPIFAGGKKIGVLIFQFPLNTLNQIMASRAGMGANGETYIVGDDLLMRSDSSLDPENHSVVASFRRPEQGRADTPATRAALRGESGTMLTVNYHNVPVLTAYAPLDFAGLSWSLLAEIDKAEAFAAITRLRWLALLIGTIGGAGIVAVALLVTRAIVRPIRGVVAGLLDLSQGEGDLTARLPVTSADEIGRLADCFNQFMDKLHEMITAITGGVATLATSSTEILQIAGQMSEHSRQTTSKSGSVAVAVTAVDGNIATVSAAMAQSSSNTGMVAAAAEEMSGTINEIAHNSEQASSISAEAVRRSREAGAKMAELTEAAQAIGKITETISDISDQTNLLALNATIEAARAGEAGKGFAVVAHEIKELSRQTAAATDHIKRQIEGVQAGSNTAMQTIRQIEEVIEQVNEIITGIASAVEEQSVATREIAENISQASAGISAVTSNVTDSSAVLTTVSGDVAGLSRSSELMSGTCGQMRERAEELSVLARELNGLVARFRL